MSTGPLYTLAYSTRYSSKSPYPHIQPLPMRKTVYWCPKHGVRLIDWRTVLSVPSGTIERFVTFNSTRWRMRVKRRKGGHTWRWLEESHPLVKRIKLEMLLLGIS